MTLRRWRARQPARRRLAYAAVMIATVLITVVGSAESAAAAPVLRVRAAILLAPATGQVLHGIAPDARLPIASTTKLMTALLTLEHARLGVILRQNNFYPAAIDSQIGLVPGERMSVHDLLLALLLPSADDAAEDLAFNLGHRSVARFVGMMNARARRLGLTNTHYTTPSGLDTPGNYSSARDLVTLAQYVGAHHPFFAHAVARPNALLRTGRHPRLVVNRNDLVGRYRWITGVKTGHTSGAGYVLVASAARDGMPLASAVLGTASAAARDGSTLTLLGYGYASFRMVHPVLGGEVLARPSIRYRDGTHAALVAATGFSRVVARPGRVRLVVTAPRELSGPQRVRSVQGSVTVVVDGRPRERIPLLLAHALPAVSPLTIAAQTLLRPFTLCLLALALAIALAARWYRRERHRERATQPA
ncbi:MAG TPA: D-alanyl-D-alanine carboxypeptidase family protein [Solirubrobacteraceae bacterium]|nr:D-alanyl-D-alanine carboxypeptidase family protein [Solirubrobacteraceae bacterium]